MKLSPAPQVSITATGVAGACTQLLAIGEECAAAAAGDDRLAPRPPLNRAAEHRLDRLAARRPGRRRRRSGHRRAAMRNVPSRHRR